MTQKLDQDAAGFTGKHSLPVAPKTQICAYAGLTRLCEMSNSSIIGNSGKLSLITLVLLVCVSCAISSFHSTESDTILVIYHVKSGREKELEDVLRQAWNIYCDDHLVVKQPPNCILYREETGSIISEQYTLRGFFAVEYPSETVKELWEKMHSLCEKRGNNYSDIEYRHVDPITIK